jgi:hypothetical protein
MGRGRATPFTLSSVVLKQSPIFHLFIELTVQNDSYKMVYLNNKDDTEPLKSILYILNCTMITITHAVKK